MKKILLVLTIAVVVVACNSHPGTGAADSKISSYTDTIGLAQFQAWKVQNELADPNVYYNQGSSSSSNTAARKTTKSRSANQTWSKTSESQNTAKAPLKKKGWSKAAKGAAIGGGSGAVLGAIIGKNNRVVGAVIGGVLGGGVGYGIGRHMDKKDGR